MSSRWTISLSVGQMYCCLSRVLHFLWSKLNDTPADACVAANSFTGIETRPNETVAPAIALAMVCASVIPGGILAKFGDRPVPQGPGSDHHASERTRKGRSGALVLVLKEDVRRVVALRLQSVGPAAQRGLIVVLATEAQIAPAGGRHERRRELFRIGDAEGGAVPPEHVVDVVGEPRRVPELERGAQARGLRQRRRRRQSGQKSLQHAEILAQERRQLKQDRAQPVH